MWSARSEDNITINSFPIIGTTAKPTTTTTKDPLDCPSRCKEGTGQYVCDCDNPSVPKIWIPEKVPVTDDPINCTARCIEGTGQYLCNCSGPSPETRQRPKLPKEIPFFQKFKKINENFVKRSRTPEVYPGNKIKHNNVEVNHKPKDIPGLCEDICNNGACLSPICDDYCTC